MSMVRARRGRGAGPALIQAGRGLGAGPALLHPNRELQAGQGGAARGARRQAMGRDAAGNAVVHQV